MSLFSLGLSERCIRDLCWGLVTEGYLITAANRNDPKHDNNRPSPPTTLDSAAFWWSGHKKDEPIPVAKMPDMKVEAVCRLGSSGIIAVDRNEATAVKAM